MTNYPPIPQRVTSERLIIRPTTRTDAPYLQKWWNDPNITAPGGHVDGMQYDASDIEEWFRRHVDGRPYAKHFVICLREPHERPIGEFYIACDDRPGGVSFSLAIGEQNLWGQGYARETIMTYAQTVFSSGCCETMRVDVRRDNERAIGLFESIGFDVEQLWADGRSQTMILTRAAFEFHHSAAQAG